MNDAKHDGDVARVLDFWFGAPGSSDYAKPREMWFAKDEAFDRRIVDTFSPLIEKALRGELGDWGTDEKSGLARILLLDQFTRNAFRGQARAFAGDAQALAAASAMVGAKLDERLPPFLRAFVYMPFEHAEGMAMQDEAVRLFTRLAAIAPEIESMLDYARRHRAVIETFGRFPHRNAALGRASTAAELEYLARPGSGF